MLRYRTELTLLRAIAIFGAGILAGIQVALYLFDLYDDGAADERSAMIGVLLLLLGLIVAVWPFRRGRGSGAASTPST